MPGPPVPIPTPPPTYDPQPAANSYASLLWKHINDFVKIWLKNHHYNHEPGGVDEVQIPLGGLADVTLGSAVANGDALVYSAAGTCWTNGAGGGGGPHQVHFSVLLPVTVIPPGPTNITGAVMMITAVRFSSDGGVSGTLTPGGSFSVNNSVDRTDDLAIPWVDGRTMTLAIASQDGDGTYLTIDVAAG